MTTVEVSVLGPLEVRVGGSIVGLPGRRPAAVLAILALAGGQTVSVDELTRGVWGDDHPGRGKGSLQTNIARLRRVLGDAAIITGPAGYRLGDGVHVDLARFTRLVNQAAADPDRAANALDQALGLWRGEPLVDLSDHLDRNDRPALTERYLSAMEQRVDLWLAEGAAATVIIHLRPLVEQHPLRESLWERLLRAMRDAGRIAEALERYAAMRQRIADDLGVDPSPKLRDLHLALVSAGERGRPAAGSAKVLPRQLPAVPSNFVGREAEMSRMDAAAESGGSSPILVLHGPGGSGKTTLAVRWGQRHLESIPDGQLVVNLRGHGPGEPLGTAAALGHLLRGVGVSDADIPADVESAGALWRTTLAERRALLVLDDARTADQVRPLLPGGRNVVVVTSRSGLRGLIAREGAARVEVGPLPTMEAVRFLGDRLNRDGTDLATGDELHELAKLCGNLPVALGIAAERAGRGGPNGLTGLLGALRQPDERLTTLRSDASADIRAVFDASYHELDTEGAAMYRLLGLHTDTSVSVPTAAALMGVSARSARDILDRLADYHLIEAHSPDWYAMHDLVRDHATEMCQKVDPAADRQAAVFRARSWYLHTAQNAVRAFSSNPPRRLDGAPAPSVEPQTFPDHHAALAWCAEHRRGLSTVFDAAVASGDVAMAGDVAALVGAYCDHRGAYDERVRLFDRLTPAATAAGDGAVLARCVSARGIFHGRRAEHEVALAAFERARELSVAAGDRDGELRAMYAAASTHEFLGRSDLAMPVLERVVARRRQDGDGVQLLQARQKLAQTYRYAGRLDQAEEAAMELLAECRSSGNRRGAARALDTLAELAVDRGLLDEVERRYAGSAAIYTALGADYEVARVANELAKARLVLGRPHDAAEPFQRALAIVDALGASDTAELNRADIVAALDELRSAGEAAT